MPQGNMKWLFPNLSNLTFNMVNLLCMVKNQFKMRVVCCFYRLDIFVLQLMSALKYVSIFNCQMKADVFVS